LFKKPIGKECNKMKKLIVILAAIAIMAAMVIPGLAAGSAPKVVGNTRGAVLMSNKIFAGLETPTAYNTVGGVSNNDSNWELAITESLNLTPSSWTQVAEGKVPARVV
jgi:hypothetical protein